MIALPDTSFLCVFYRQQDNSRLAAAYAATMKEPLRKKGKKTVSTVVSVPESDEQEEALRERPSTPACCA